MPYAFEVTSGGIIYTPSFMTIGSGVQVILISEAIVLVLLTRNCCYDSHMYKETCT
jgi:hypothetical protein